MGPPWSQRQLALLLREEVAAGERPASVYFESHCDADLESVRRAMRDAGLSTAPGQQQQAGQEAGVDVAITPVVSSLLGVPGTSAASYALVQVGRWGRGERKGACGRGGGTRGGPGLSRRTCRCREGPGGGG